MATPPGVNGIGATFAMEFRDPAPALRGYPGGIGLRFARVKRYRPDKTPDEVDTIDSLRALL